MKELLESSYLSAMSNINQELRDRINKAIDFIVKHCVNEKASKELGMTCYTMADTNELEKIVNILKGSDSNDK